MQIQRLKSEPQDGIALDKDRTQAILALNLGSLVLARACNDTAAADILDAGDPAIEEMVP